MPNLRKPARWALTRGLVEPEWGWFWREDSDHWPLWEGSGSPRSYGNSSVFGTLAGNMVWSRGKDGKGLEAFANGDQCNFTPKRFIPVDAINTVVVIGGHANGTGSFQIYSEAIDTLTYSILYARESGDDIRWRYRTSAEGHVDLDAAAGSAWNNDRTNIIIMRQFGIADRELWVNGVLKVANTTSRATFVATQASLGGTVHAQDFIGVTYGAYRFPGYALSDSQIHQISDDPFGPFRMRDEAGVVYALPAAGGATPHGPLGHPLWGPLAGPVGA